MSGTFRSNVVTRFGRLYPLHLCALIAVASMQWLLVGALGHDAFVYSHNDGYHLALNFVLLQSSGLEQGFSFNAPSWSISTEFLINLLFLALITLPRRTATILISLLTVAAIATLADRGLLDSTRALGWIDNDLIRTTAGFFIGVLAYGIGRRVSDKLHPIAADLSSVILCGGIACYMASPMLWRAASDLVICLLGFPLLLLSVLSSTAVAAALRLHPLLYLGKISYSIYLIHFPLQLLLHILAVWFEWTIPFDSPLCFCGFISAVVLVSSLTYHRIELPGRQIIRAMTVRSSATAVRWACE